jgi:parallel beta-helix repeat protein
MSGFTIQNDNRLGEGVRIDSCCNNFFNNIIYTPNDNIRIAGDKNNISGITITSDSITLSGDSNTISDNVITNNHHGIYLVDSCDNIITNNSFFNCGLFISEYTVWNNIVTNNTINGKPLVYVDNESDLDIDVDAGQIILLNCTNITIQNQEIFNTTVGIQIWGSNTCVISDNTIVGNRYGIWIHDLNNTINDNIITNNNYDGILLYYDSDFNDIFNNIITNNDEGINIHSSENNTIFNNFFNNLNNVYDAGNNIWNISKTPGANIVGGPYLGGNYWSDYTGIDIDDDGLGDTDIPHGPGDYLPLIYSNEPPVADFSYTPLHPTTVDMILFNDTSIDPNGSIVNWSWEFEEDSISYEQNPSYYYSSNGFYSVTLQVTDDIGFSDEISKLILIGIISINMSQINSGWNLKSLPRSDPANKTNLIILYDGCYYSWQQACDNQIIDTNVFGWSGGSYFLADVLYPSEGYWIYSYEQCTLKSIS